MELVLMSSVMNSANRQTFYGISHILTYIKKESEKFILKNIKVSVYCSGCGEGKYSTVPLPQSGFDSFRPRLNIWSQIHLLKKQTKNVFTTACNHGIVYTVQPPFLLQCVQTMHRGKNSLFLLLRIISKCFFPSTAVQVP